MPPKRMNAKAAEAMERKEADKSSKAAKAAKDAEDREWHDAGEGAKSKAQAKRSAKGEEHEETLRRKAEAKAMAKAEDEEMSSYGKKNKGKTGSDGKVTAFQLRKMEFAEKKRREEEAAKKAAADKNEVKEDDYAKLVDVQNANRDEDSIDARGLDAAVDAMDKLTTGGPAGGEDQHPERRMKAAYAAFMEAELPRVKQEKPGLKLNQYKDMLWKEWKKHPSNPMNQVAQ